MKKILIVIGIVLMSVLSLTSCGEKTYKCEIDNGVEIIYKEIKSLEDLNVENISDTVIIVIRDYAKIKDIYEVANFLSEKGINNNRVGNIKTGNSVVVFENIVILLNSNDSELNMYDYLNI